MNYASILDERGRVDPELVDAVRQEQRSSGHHAVVVREWDAKRGTAHEIYEGPCDLDQIKRLGDKSVPL